MGKAGINHTGLVLAFVILFGLHAVPAAAQLTSWSTSLGNDVSRHFLLVLSDAMQDHASEAVATAQDLPLNLPASTIVKWRESVHLDWEDQLLIRSSSPSQSSACPSSPDSFPQRWVCGVVSDETGAPVADVLVEAQDVDRRVTRTAKTDANGRYVISGLPQGWYHVTVTTPVRGAGDAVRLLLKSTDIVDLRLLPMSTLDGFIDIGGTLTHGIPITVENLDTGERFSSMSGTWGYFAFRNILPGPYKVTAYPIGFQPYETTIDVEPWTLVGEHVKVPLRTEETVTVENRASADAGAAVTTERFSWKTIEALPLQNGRTLQSLWSLVPGIVFTDSTGTLGQFTAIGERRYANRLTIDGMAADLAIELGNGGGGIGEAASGALPAYSTSGSTQTLVPLGAIDEIAIRTSNATSEYARSPGAQTSVITRSGSDHLSGTAFLDARPSSLAASNWFSNAGQAPRREAHFWNGGASAGGPILARRLFYFATWEQQNIDRPMKTTIEVPSLAARSAAAGDLQSLLNAYPMPNGSDIGNSLADFTDWFSARSELSVFNGRLDAQAGRHHVFARVDIGDSRGDGLDQLQLPATSYTRTEATATRTATVGFMSASPSFAHDLRMNVSMHRGSIVNGAAGFGNAQSLPLAVTAPGDHLAPTYAVVNMFPGPSGTVLAGTIGPNTQAQLELLDSISIVRGGHHWRFGVDYRHVQASSDGPQKQIMYRFRSVSDAIQGRAPQVTVQTTAPSSAIFESFSLFAQDTFRPSTRLSFDYGLRYSVEPAPASGTRISPSLIRFETLPQQIELLDKDEPLWNTSWTNIAPQIAGSYLLRSADRWETKIGSAWSVVFDGLTRPGAAAFGRAYPYVATSLLGSHTLPISQTELTPSLPEPFSSADRSQYYSFPRNLRSPRTYAWHLGVDQNLGHAQRLSVAYVGGAGRDLVYWYGYYEGNPMPFVNAYSNDGRSDYHGLLTEYSRHMSRGLSARVAYAWSHALDNDSGESLIPYAPPSLIEPRENRASADFDRRHVLEALASYRISTVRLPRPLESILSDWNLDVVATFRSGVPVSVTSSRIVTTGTYTVRPDVVPGVPVWIPDASSATGWSLNPAAFQNPMEARQGTLGRNSLNASPLRQIDVMATKTVRFRGPMSVEFRLQALNVFNIPNFGAPYATYGPVLDPHFGRPFQTYAEGLGSGTIWPGGLVPLQQVGGPRSIQLGIRFAF